jgi:hypothetical protein
MIQLTCADNESADPLPSLASVSRLDSDTIALAAMFSFSLQSDAARSLDDALCSALPASKAVSSAPLVRQAVAAELFRDSCRDYQHFYSEQWLLPRFRSEVESWSSGGHVSSAIVPVAVVAAASAFTAGIVLLCARPPVVRVVVPSRCGIDCVLTLLLDDSHRVPRFGVLRAPLADGSEAAGLLQPAKLLVHLQLGLTSDCAAGPADGCEERRDADGDFEMTAAQSPKVWRVRAPATCLFIAIGHLFLRSRARRAASSSSPCAAL